MMFVFTRPGQSTETPIRPPASSKSKNMASDIAITPAFVAAYNGVSGIGSMPTSDEVLTT